MATLAPGKTTSAVLTLAGRGPAADAQTARPVVRVQAADPGTARHDDAGRGVLVTLSPAAEAARRAIRTQSEAEEAVRTISAWLGLDPARAAHAVQTTREPPPARGTVLLQLTFAELIAGRGRRDATAPR